MYPLLALPILAALCAFPSSSPEEPVEELTVVRTVLPYPEPQPLPEPEPLPAPQPLPAPATEWTPGSQEPDGRPGLVEIPAGQTVIGAEFDRVSELMKEFETSKVMLAGELGRKRVSVDRFWLAPTKLTNEMYLQYVQDTGAVPPPSWAVISKELRQQLIKEGKQFNEEGMPQNPSYKFDEAEQARWWTEHWQDEGQKWEMPGEEALNPVVFVSHADAVAYCAWAGLRLPFEVEYTRAARSNTDREYPWGDEFDKSRIAFVLTEPRAYSNKLVPVGSLDNASPFGILDMVGLVWELTETRYDYLHDEKSAKERVEIVNASGRTEKVYPEFDESKYVLKGGCFMTNAEATRIDARVGFDPNSKAPVLGFRVAASENRLGDFANMNARGKLRINLRDSLDYANSLGVSKRSYPDMAVVRGNRNAPKEPLKAPELPDTYRVFGKCEAFVLTPRTMPFDREPYNQGNVAKIDKFGKQGEFPIVGALTSSVSFTSDLRRTEGNNGDENGEPLPAGAYTLMYCPPMRDKEIKELGGWTPATAEEDRPTEVETKPTADISKIGLEPATAYILVVDTTSTARMALPLRNLNSKLKFQSDKKQESSLVVDLERDRLMFEVELGGKGSKSYLFGIGLRPVDAEGNSLVQTSAWDAGAFTVQEKKK